MYKYGRLFCIALGALTITGCRDTEVENKNTETADLGDIFQGINGCAVVYSPANEQCFLYNEDMCNQEASPYSTFKIISALSGLQNGVIVDESSKMNYSGKAYGNADWNGDLTLEEAFRKSCI